MSNEFTLDAELRADQGKGASRRLRRSNKVPAVVYGGEGEPTSIALNQHEVGNKLENEAFYSHILTLKIDGKSQEAVLRDLQRHPSKPLILHMDFQRVSKNKAVHVHVPLHFINEDKSEGIKLDGGLISKTLTEVEVSCLPKDLPEFIEVDVQTLRVGESIHLSELQLPQGIELLGLSHGNEHDTAVVSVHKPRGVAEEDEADVVPAGEVPTAGDDTES